MEKQRIAGWEPTVNGALRMRTIERDENLVAIAEAMGFTGPFDIVEHSNAQASGIRAFADGFPFTFNPKTDTPTAMLVASHFEMSMHFHSKCVVVETRDGRFSYTQGNGNGSKAARMRAMRDTIMLVAIEIIGATK